LPRSFAAEDQDRARFQPGKDQDGVRFMTGEDQTTRREDLDGVMTAEQEMSRYEGARRAKNYRRRIKSRAKRKTFREKSVGPKFSQMPHENAKPLEITSFYPCHFYLELCKLHQMQN